MSFFQNFVVQNCNMIPQGHQLLQEHNFQRVLNHLLLLQLLVCSHSSIINELSSIYNTSKIESRIYHMAKLLEHNNLIKQVSRQSRHSPHQKLILLVQFLYYISVDGINLSFDDIHPIVVDVFEDNEVLTL